jgi:hypothetical protein
MITKTKTALVAALILGSASTVFAADFGANADRVGSSYYGQPVAADVYARAPLTEGRAVAAQYDYRFDGSLQARPLQSEQQHWFERAPIDFNS